MNTVELFNGRLQQECLNENWFMSLEDARCKIEAWRIHYNQGFSLGLDDPRPNLLKSLLIARTCHQH
ncbi:integrase core domain-containing protein [Edwardsiella tarda]|uniref:integrase core domain-containing protein n=1 Tax=Edwardsiella tarda TaxID=636 RepID=UPI000D5197B9|nr:transposase [Edwardsiella tarda]